MREHVADIYGLEEYARLRDPQRHRPRRPRSRSTTSTRCAREFAAPDERLVVLVGRLVYEKGFQLALEALPGLIEELGGRALPRRRLGHRTRPSCASRPTSSGSMEHGTFLGWIGDDVLHSLYRIADLCVIPSLYEPFGLVALEAMASGCPCIVADTGGLREIVPHDERVGLRFNGGDAEHLAVMVERLLTDEPLRERLVAEASEHVLRFDWVDVARQTAAIYAELANPRLHAPQSGVRRHP